MASFLFGVIIAVGYYFATGWWQNTDRILFWTAMGMTLLFSIGAAVVRTQVVKGGAVRHAKVSIAAARFSTFQRLPVPILFCSI